MIIRNNMFNVEKTVYSPREAVKDYDNHSVSEVVVAVQAATAGNRPIYRMLPSPVY
jgi:hypothetical protein